MTLDRVAVAQMIDHTLLKPEATDDEVAALCRDAVELGVLAVCVSPNKVGVARRELAGDALVATVAGFPSGAHRAEAKADEARRSVDDGADEVDMVIDLGLARARRFDEVAAEVALVRAGVPAPVRLKVILETALWDDEVIVALCHAADAGGADFVKTSTGFHPSGGASEAAVRAMAATVGGRLGVKASGGIRTADTALAMIAAGATRLGTSGSAAILDGL